MCHGLTWDREAVLVLGDIWVHRLEHHPHGEREEGGEETVEHQIEEQDQSWGWERGGTQLEKEGASKQGIPRPTPQMQASLTHSNSPHSAHLLV